MEIRSRRPREEVLGIINSLPAYVRGPDDPHKIGAAFWAGFANSLFESIHDAAVIKSHGLRDELGQEWEPISNHTKAYKRKDIRNRLRLPNINPRRPSLTEAQDKAWRYIYAKMMSKLRRQAAQGAAPLLSLLQRRERKEAASLAAIDNSLKNHAAGAAWNYVKKRLGAQTILQLVQRLDARIGHDTGALLESLAPTDTNPYRPGPNQTFEVRNGKMTFGSKIPYFHRFHKHRKLWPEDISLWHDRATSAGVRSMMARLQEVL